MLELVKNLSGQSFEELVVFEYLRGFQIAHFLRQLLAWLHQNVSLDARVHVVLDVYCVLLGDLHVHLDVVLAIWVLLLVWV